jgi:uncharacterized membrane protein (UPF0127 family)
MKKTPLPVTPPRNPAKKLYVLAGIMVLIAIIAIVIVFVIPDKPGNPPKEKLRITFEKQGTAVITSPDGKEKAAFDLEIADTEEAQKIGLMYRESMADNQGMLFVYKTADKMNFWMKNTYLPLDLVFFLPDSTVYKVYPDNQPFTESGIAPAKECQFALEINAGLAKVHNLAPGDKISWKRLSK